MIHQMLQLLKDDVPLIHLQESKKYKDLTNYILRDKLKSDFLNKVQEGFEQHYPLLAYISSLYADTTITEIGTFRGLSALALSYNKSNNILSFDIESFTEIEPVDNITFIVDDYNNYKSQILQSSFIFFDAGTLDSTDPNDSLLEYEFYNFLYENNFTGTVMFDDIHMSPKTKQFWTNISQTKYDISKIGHRYSRHVELINGRPGFLLCGSGLVLFE